MQVGSWNDTCLYFPFERNESVLRNGSKAPENLLRNNILARKLVFTFHVCDLPSNIGVSREAFSPCAAFFFSNLDFP